MRGLHATADQKVGSSSLSGRASSTPLLSSNRPHGSTEASFEGPDGHPAAGSTYQVRISGGYDPVTGRQLFLTGSADIEDATIVLRDRLRQQVQDNTAAKTNVTLGYFLALREPRPPRPEDPKTRRPRIRPPRLRPGIRAHPALNVIESLLLVRPTLAVARARHSSVPDPSAGSGTDS